MTKVFYGWLYDRFIDRKKSLSADQSIFKSIAPMLLNWLDKTLDGYGPILLSIWNDCVREWQNGMTVHLSRHIEITRCFFCIQEIKSLLAKDNRPVSVLQTVTKIFERLIQGQLRGHISQFLSSFLCGYQTGFSTNCLAFVDWKMENYAW